MIRITRPVLWGELDALGHVNNTVYFRYFEEARIELLKAIGLPASAEASIGPILAATSCRFIRPLGHPDTITCTASVGRIGRTSFVVEYAVVSEAVGEAATGDSAVVVYDYAARSKVEIPAAIRAALEGLA